MLPTAWNPDTNSPEEQVSESKQLSDIDNICWCGISVDMDGDVIDGQGNEVEDWDEVAKLILATVNKISRLVKAAKEDES